MARLTDSLKDRSIARFCYKKVVYKSAPLLNKVRKFSTGFFRPKKIDQSCTFKILIFTQDRHQFYFICMPFGSNLCIRVLLEFYFCAMHVFLCNTVVSY